MGVGVCVCLWVCVSVGGCGCGDTTNGMILTVDCQIPLRTPTNRSKGDSCFIEQRLLQPSFLLNGLQA